MIIHEQLLQHIHGLKSKPGEHLSIRRETLMNIIVSSFNEINHEQHFDRTVYESFNICGVNPYLRDDDALPSFRNHFDNMSEIKAYELLLKNKVSFVYNDPYVDKITIKGKNLTLKSKNLIYTSLNKYDLVLLAPDHDDFDYNLIEKESKLIVDTRG